MANGNRDRLKGAENEATEGQNAPALQIIVFPARYAPIRAYFPPPAPDLDQPQDDVADAPSEPRWAASLHAFQQPDEQERRGEPA